MNRTHQMKAYRFTGGHNIVAPSDGFPYDIPWMAPHASGRLLESAIRQYQLGYKVDAAHKVTPSRNKREGRYVGWMYGKHYRDPFIIDFDLVPSVSMCESLQYDRDTYFRWKL